MPCENSSFCNPVQELPCCEGAFISWSSLPIDERKTKYAFLFIQAAIFDLYCSWLCGSLLILPPKIKETKVKNTENDGE